MNVSALIYATESLKKREGELLPTLKTIFFEGLKLKYKHKTIKDVLLSHKGGSWGNGYFDGGIPAKVLRSPDIRFGFIDLENAEERYFSAKEFENFSLKNNDILVIKSNGSLDLVGKSQIYKIKDHKINVVASNFLMVLSPNESIVYPEYLDLFLKSPESLVWRFDTQKTTTGLRNLNSSAFLKIEIPIPDTIAEQKFLCNSFYKFLQGEISSEEVQIKKFYTISNSKEMLSSEYCHQLDLIKKLRQQILQDAVQGKLVPQDPNDEPASVLLRRIKVEKEQLIREKKIKKEKPLPAIKPEEIPFEIPTHWVWSRLSTISVEISTGPFGSMLHKSDYVENGIPLVNPMNMVGGLLVASSKMMVSYNTRERLKNYILYEDDIVIARRGEMGRCAIVSKDENGWLCGTGSFFLRLLDGVHSQFFIRIFSSNYIEKFLRAASVGSTMNNLNHKILNQILIPIPPKEEQNRIISKLNKLMQLCYELEQNIKQNQTYTKQLLQVALKEALEPVS